MPQKRRQENVNRDYAISTCKLQLMKNEISLYGYMQKISILFNFADAKKIPSICNITLILQTKSVAEKEFKALSNQVFENL